MSGKRRKPIEGSPPGYIKHHLDKAQWKWARQGHFSSVGYTPALILYNLPGISSIPAASSARLHMAPISQRTPPTSMSFLCLSVISPRSLSPRAPALRFLCGVLEASPTRRVHSRCTARVHSSRHSCPAGYKFMGDWSSVSQVSSPRGPPASPLGRVKPLRRV